MNQLNACIIYITINCFDKAQNLSKILLENKLIACSNIIGQNNPIVSMYSWEGKIEIDNEFLMICKSRCTLVDQITQLVKQNHPYKCPEIIATPIIGGNQQYIDWIFENTQN